MTKKIIQESIDYIEENLKAEISAKELSERAGFSLFHYYRVFQKTVGMPVMQFVVRRRLLHAIYEVQCGLKMVDAALQYGFGTQAGFYKAFLREFGYTPTQYLLKGKGKKPYRIDILKENAAMVTHKRLKEILKVWGLEKEELADFIYEETGNVNENAFYVGSEYLIHRTKDAEMVEKLISLAVITGEIGIDVSKPIKTLDGKQYYSDGDFYFYVTRRQQGSCLKASSLFLEDYTVKARFIGEMVGQLSIALADADISVKDINIYDQVTEWAIPELQDKIQIPDWFLEQYSREFAEIYPLLSRQLIHRDPNPGNIIQGNECWGIIDFGESERNVRILDPCYAATAVLSENFREDDSEHLQKWIEIYKNIIIGYDEVVKLTDEEWKAIPYLVLSNQLIASAWFAEQEKYQELYLINVKMTEWMLEHFEELKL